jgi:dihydrodipicolinate synthase/N-acetylneuraminate lyase
MAAASPLRGIVAPVPTPFTDDGSLDLDALERHLVWLESTRLDGVLLLGSNGEFPSLSADERRAVATRAACAAPRLLKILNVGSCVLAEAVSAAQGAGDLGFDAVLCPPPFYYRSAPADGLAAFFRGLLDASPLPVLLYHIPAATGIGIHDELLTTVADHPRLAGVKDSSGDPSECARFAGAMSGGRSLFVGNDRLVRTARDLGGAGSITACASVAPDLVAEAMADDRAFERLVMLRGLLESHGLIPAVKAILGSRGLGGVRPRPPLVPLDPRIAADLVAQAEMTLAPPFR